VPESLSVGARNDGAVMKTTAKSQVPVENTSVSELFGQLSADASHLIRQEFVLAKIELRDGVKALASAGVKLSLSLALAIPGVGALAAALVIGLGILLGSYWLSALIVGAAMLAIAGVLVFRAVSAIKSFPPRETARTLRGDAAWVKHEADRVKEKVTAQ